MQRDLQQRSRGSVTGHWWVFFLFMLSFTFPFADVVLRLNSSLFRYLHPHPLPFPRLVVALTQEQAQRSSCLRSLCPWSTASSLPRTVAGSEGCRFCSCPLTVSSYFLFNVSTFLPLDNFLMTCTFPSLSFHPVASYQSQLIFLHEQASLARGNPLLHLMDVLTLSGTSLRVRHIAKSNLRDY